MICTGKILPKIIKIGGEAQPPSYKEMQQENPIL